MRLPSAAPGQKGGWVSHAPTLGAVVALGLLLGVASEARAQADRCPPEAGAWASEAAAALGRPIEVLACPQGHLILGIEGRASGILKVDLQEGGEGGFRQAGGYALSPIVEVNDFSRVPEDHREAFAALAEWLEAGGARPEVKAVMPSWLLGVASALAGLLLLAGAGLLYRRGDEAAPATLAGGDPGPPRRWLWLGFGLALLLLLANLELARPPTEIHVDGIRDLLMARNLQEGAEGSRTGSPSSALFVHGAAWQHFLAAVGAGGDEGPRRTRVLVLLLLALGPLLLRASRPHFGWAAALLIATFWASSSLQPDLVRLHWQPTLVPQALGLWLALSLLALGGSRAALVGAALAFSLGSQVHLGFFFLLPAQLILGWVARRPAITGALTVGALGLGWALLSPDALEGNLAWGWEALVGAGLATGAAASAPSLAFAGWLGPLMILPLLHAIVSWRLGVARRADAFLVLTSVSYGIACSAVLWRHQQSNYYWVPLLLLQALHAGRLLGIAVDRWLERRAGRWAVAGGVAVAVAAASLAIWRHPARLPEGPLDLEELAAVVGALEARGLSAPEAWSTVRAGEGLVHELDLGIWAFAGCQRDRERIGGAPRDGRRLMLLRAPREGVAAPGPGLETIPGRGRSFLLLEVLAWVDAEALRLCAPGAGCQRMERAFPNTHFQGDCYGPNWPFEATARLAEPPPAEGTIRVGVRVPAGAEERLLLLGAPEPPGDPEASCRGELLQAEGVEIEATGQPGLYRLRGTDEAQEGELELRWPWQEARCLFAEDPLALPLLELPPEWVRLLAAAPGDGAG